MQCTLVCEIPLHPPPPFLGLHLGPPFPTGFASISPVRRHDPNSKTRRQLWSPSLQGIGILHCWMTWGEMNQPLMDGRKSTKIEKMYIYIYELYKYVYIYSIYSIYTMYYCWFLFFKKWSQYTPELIMKLRYISLVSMTRPSLPKHFRMALSPDI